MAHLNDEVGFKHIQALHRAFPDEYRMHPHGNERWRRVRSTCLSAILLLQFAISAAAVRAAENPAGDALMGSTGPDSGLSVSVQDGPIDPARYVLGPGDELTLSALGRISMSSRLRVDPEGVLWIPDLGPLKIGGLTLRQARERLAQIFGGGSRGLQVYLNLTRLRSLTVYVEGEVRRPGAIQGTAVMRASQAIQSAGGLTPGASQRAIVLRSPGDSLRPVDLVRFSRLGDRNANPTLLDGDHLFVPKRIPSVYLYGPVPYPGGYEYRTGDRLSELIRIAGGFREEALLDRARVLRFTDDRHSDTLDVDMGAIVHGTDDLMLREGDRVFVPSKSEYHEDRHVTLTGEIARPGVYSLSEGRDRVSDLIERAGGLTETAARNAILVVRAGPSTLERDPEFERLSKLSRNEMTDAEYQIFRTKLASIQNTFRIDYDAVSEVRGTRSGGAEPKEGGARDVLLRSGDLLFVDRITHSVRLAGEVRRPGLVTFDPDRSGTEYIQLAGGFTAKAKRSGVRLTRFATGQTLPLNDARQVEPGDLIFVPDRPDIHLLGVIRDAIMFAAAAATVVVAIRR